MKTLIFLFVLNISIVVCFDLVKMLEKTISECSSLNETDDKTEDKTDDSLKFFIRCQDYIDWRSIECNKNERKCKINRYIPKDNDHKLNFCLDDCVLNFEAIPMHKIKTLEVGAWYNYNGIQLDLSVAILQFFRKTEIFSLTDSHAWEIPKNMLENFPNLRTFIWSNNGFSKLENGKWIDNNYFHQNFFVKNNLTKIIIMSGSNLISDNLPASLFPKYIEELDLSYNGLTEIPKDLGESLTKLNFRSNKLSKINSDAFNNLKHLTVLDLSENNLDFSSSKIFSKNEKLKSLILESDKCVRDKHFPSDLLESNRELETFRYSIESNSACQGVHVPTDFFQQQNSTLKKLQLSVKNLTGYDVVQFVEKLTVLDRLDISHNQIHTLEFEKLPKTLTTLIIDVEQMKINCSNCQELQSIFDIQKSIVDYDNLKCWDNTSDPIVYYPINEGHKTYCNNTIGIVVGSVVGSVAIVGSLILVVAKLLWMKKIRSMFQTLKSAFTRDFYNDTSLDLKKVLTYPLIGEGAFGKVYKGDYKGEMCAFKVLFFKDEKGKKNFVEFLKFLREVQAMKSLRDNINLLPLLRYCYKENNPNQAVLIVPYMKKESVRHRLCLEPLLTWAQRGKVAMGTANGLKSIHASDIIHGDIKPENILLDENYEPKIGDFGLSRFNDSNDDQNKRGTPCYLPPEYVKGRIQSFALDTFSFGVTLFDLVVGHKLHQKDKKNKKDKEDEKDKEDLLQKCLKENVIITDERVKLDDHFPWDKCLFIVAKFCTRTEHKTRPKMEQVANNLKLVENVYNLGSTHSYFGNMASNITRCYENKIWRQTQEEYLWFGRNIQLETSLMTGPTSNVQSETIRLRFVDTDERSFPSAAPPRHIRTTLETPQPLSALRSTNGRLPHQCLQTSTNRFERFWTGIGNVWISLKKHVMGCKRTNKESSDSTNDDSSTSEPGTSSQNMDVEMMNLNPPSGGHIKDKFCIKS